MTEQVVTDQFQQLSFPQCGINYSYIPIDKDRVDIQEKYIGRDICIQEYAARTSTLQYNYQIDITIFICTQIYSTQ